MSKMKVALMIKISGETAKKRLNMWEGGEITNSAFISPVFKITELLTECQIFLDAGQAGHQIEGAHLTSPLPLVNGGDLIDQGRPTTPLRRFFDWSSDQVEEEALVHVVPPPLGLTLSLDSI